MGDLSLSKVASETLKSMLLLIPQVEYYLINNLAI